MLHFGNRSLRINCRIFAIGASGQPSHRIAQETGAEGHSGEMCKRDSLQFSRFRYYSLSCVHERKKRGYGRHASNSTDPKASCSESRILETLSTIPEQEEPHAEANDCKRPEGRRMQHLRLAAGY